MAEVTKPPPGKVRFVLAWGANRVGDVVQPGSETQRRQLLEATWYGRRIAVAVEPEPEPTPAAAVAPAPTPTEPETPPPAAPRGHRRQRQ